jgi:hypothetical protein
MFIRKNNEIIKIILNNNQYNADDIKINKKYNMKDEI